MPDRKPPLPDLDNAREREILADGMRIGLAALRSLTYLPYMTAGSFADLVERGDERAVGLVREWYADDRPWPPEENDDE